MGIICAVIAIIAGIYGWTFSCILFSIISVVIIGTVQIIHSIISASNNSDDGTKYGNYVYYDYDSSPGCWAHNDTLYSIMIIREDKLELNNNLLITDEGWEIDVENETDPSGSCGEFVERHEKRKNGLSFTYRFYWKDKCWWYPQFDVVRMLFDTKYFSDVLAMANKGNPDAQTLVGCCYGHNGKMGMNVVEHDIEKALYWWREAAKSNYQYAMKELALYYWHKNDLKEAYSWNEKSGRQVFVIYHDGRLNGIQ